jgi:regulator of sigma D
MKISEIKQFILEYKDFYGGDIPNTDEIKRARSKQELRDILHNHRIFLEDQLADALNHLREFKDSITL